MKNRAKGKTIELARSVTFQSAHRLTRVPDSHKCARLHGHTYRLRVFLAGDVQDDGFVVDNAKIDEFLAEIRGRLDHRFLNELEIEGVSGNPTAENLIAWVYHQTPDILRPLLDKIELYEGPDSVFVLHEHGWSE